MTRFAVVATHRPEHHLPCMWIASKFGWFSIVKKDGGVHVRARNEADLAELQAAVGGEFAKMKIHSTPAADYCARVFVPQEEAAHVLHAIMRTFAESIDYANFKGEIGALPSQRDKLSCYHDVWDTMFRYQRSRRPTRQGETPTPSFE